MIWFDGPEVLGSMTEEDMEGYSLAVNRRG
jgi:hypothetical protein